MNKIILIGLIIWSGGTGMAQSISSSVMSASGASFESENFTLHFSIGEPLNTIIESGDIMISQGMLQITLNEIFSDIALPSTHELSVYPNPTSDGIMIQTSDKHKSLNYKVFDVNGALLLHAPIITESTKADLSHLPKGNYILKVYDKKQQQQSLKVIY